MPYFLLASFPNSRVKPRSATQSADTWQVALLDYTQPLTLVAEADPNRTYILLKNLHQTVAFWYVYATTVTVNPSLVATDGFVNQIVIFAGQLYQKQDAGVSVNWNAVAIEDVGESVDPLQTASLEQINDDIYAAADSAVAVVPAVVIGVDEGVG